MRQGAFWNKTGTYTRDFIAEHLQSVTSYPNRELPGKTPPLVAGKPCRTGGENTWPSAPFPFSDVRPSPIVNAPPCRILSPGLGRHHMRSTLDTVAAIGLAIGGAFGLAGTFVASAPLRETLWTIDGAALVVATALLTMKYQRLAMTA